MRRFVTLLIGVFAAGIYSVVFGGAASKDAAVKPLKMVVTMTGQQSGSATLWFKSRNKIRMQTKAANPAKSNTGGPDLIIIDGKDGYALNSSAKMGTKMPSAQLLEHLMRGPFDVKKLDPRSMIKEIEKEGFKKTGTGKVGKDDCDIYKGKGKEGAKSGGEGALWVRRSDQHPLKFEMKGKEGTAVGTIDWNPKLNDSLFKVPSGYKIQDMSQMMMGKGKMPGGMPPGGPPSGRR